MKSNPSQMAVMNIDKDEEILAGYATADIAQVGMYKLLVKKKVDGMIDWAHFVERDNGLKEKVIRDSVKSLDELDIVIGKVSIMKGLGYTDRHFSQICRSLNR